MPISTQSYFKFVKFLNGAYFSLNLLNIYKADLIDSKVGHYLAYYSIPTEYLLKEGFMKLFITLFMCSAFSFVARADIEADNSAKNKRDGQIQEYTADQQGLSAAETEVTRQIRESIMKDSSMSVYAKNIKIINVRGEITLKGPVRTANERKKIVEKTHAVTGVKKIINQIDVITK